MDGRDAKLTSDYTEDTVWAQSRVLESMYDLIHFLSYLGKSRVYGTIPIHCRFEFHNYYDLHKLKC